MAAGEISFEEASGAKAAPVAATPGSLASTSKAPAGEVSFEEASGGQAPQRSFGDVLKSNVATAAAVGDFVWGFFPMAEGIGRDLGVRMYGAATGEPRRTSAQAGQLASQDTALPQNPLQKLMRAAGYGDDYDKSDVTKAVSWFSEHLDKGADWIEKNTNGALLKEDVSSLTNVLMLGLLNLRKGGMMKPEAKSLEAARRGPAGEENRASYYTPAPEVAEATAAVTKPRLKGPPAIMQPVQPEPGAFQIGTSGEAVPDRPISEIEQHRQQAAKTYDEQPWKLYHGSNTAVSDIKSGIMFLGRTPEYAAEYGRTVSSIEAIPGKILDIDDKIRTTGMPEDVVESFGDIAKKAGYRYLEFTAPTEKNVPAAQMPRALISLYPKEDLRIVKAEPHAYESLPGGTEPVAGHWEGPRGEFEETSTKPGLGERAIALARDDKRWYARLPKDQSGKADPRLVASIAAAGGFAAWAALNPEKAKEIGLGGLLVAGAVKGKGGMWPPESVERLARERLHAEGVKRTIAGKERGSVDPKLLARMALATGGAALGAYLSDDSPVTGALVGAAAAALAPRALRATGAAANQLAKGELKQAVRELIPGPVSAAFAHDKSRVDVQKEMNAAELFSRRAELARNRLINSIVTLVPDPKGREKIAHWLEGNTAIVLTPKEQQAAASMKRFFGEQGVAGMDAGVLKDTIENYVTHVFGRGNLPLLDAFFAQRAAGTASTPFAKARTGPPTIAEVNTWMAKNGKPPITADIAKIAEIYGRSLTRAIANKSVLDALKLRTTKILSGGKDVERPLIMRPGKAPGTYEPVGRTGYVAHPDIVPALKFIFSHDDSASFVRGIEALNTAAKRSAVMLSLFHAKNLIDAFAGASKFQTGKIATGAALGGLYGATQDDPVTYAMIGAGLGMAFPGMKVTAQAAWPKMFGENSYVKALRQHDPALAKMIDLSFQGGLEYSLKGGGLAVEDVGGAFYQGMQLLQGALDKTIPLAASALRGLEKVNHAMDGFLWERLHTGMKLSIFAEKYETLLQNNAAAHAKNPKVELMSEEKLAQIAASYTNDIFGGLNWRRVAAEAKTKWGAALAQGAYSPTGRRVMQLMMFAPDWTIATTRSAMKAFGPLVGQEAGTGLNGLLKPQTVSDLHRQYMLRSALYYVMIGDGLNVALSGHHIWENKDPTYIELADGRKMQFSKHTMEPYHWLLNPIQQGLNKFGQVPKEALNQIFGTEYLAPRTDRGGNVVAGPKMEGSRLSHVARTLNPIGAKQFVEGGGAGVLGSLGMPIYGKTKAERERIRQQRALDRALRGR